MALLTISIDTNFDEFWRYNLVVMASIKRGDEQVELLKYMDEIAPIGADLVTPPANYPEDRRVVLRGEAAESLTLYIYIIPHTLPPDKYVRFAPPFELEVKVKHGIRNIYTHRHMINQWSGDNLMISMETPANRDK
ncbi:MAG: hypothetical protein J6Q28_02910 [Alistipes sp.]|nr:hypothetical protein [Alistipes sp.]